MINRNIMIYWTSTILLALGMISGGIAQLLRLKETAEGIVHLGYPLYFVSIIGAWKVMGAITILVPNVPLLKEWAYAGFFFAMSGALVSHIAKGDSPVQYIAPFIFIILIVMSWYFRPSQRKV